MSEVSGKSVPECLLPAQDWEIDINNDDKDRIAILSVTTVPGPMPQASTHSDLSTTFRNEETEAQGAQRHILVHSS